MQSSNAYDKNQFLITKLLSLNILVWNKYMVFIIGYKLIWMV